MIAHKSPIIKGDGLYSRGFTLIDNVILANELTAVTTKKQILQNLDVYYKVLKEKTGIDIKVPEVVMDIFNIAYGQNTSLFKLSSALRSNLAQYDPDILNIKVTIGEKRLGDIPHSLASVEKAKSVLGYEPIYDAIRGIKSACAWCYKRLR